MEFQDLFLHSLSGSSESWWRWFMDEPHHQTVLQYGDCGTTGHSFYLFIYCGSFFTGQNKPYVMIVAFSSVQNDEPSGPNLDLGPGSLQDKKMEAEKRSMGMSDYNGDIRKAGRGGGNGGGVIYCPPGSKEAAPGDAGSYYNRVMSHDFFFLFCFCQRGVLCNLYFPVILLFLPICPSFPPFSSVIPYIIHLCSFWSSDGCHWQALHSVHQDVCPGEAGSSSLYSPPTVYKPHTLFNHSVPFRQVR